MITFRDPSAKAKREFRKNCRRLGVTPWNISDPDSRYSIGVTLNWPNARGIELQKESMAVINYAAEAAGKYNLTPVCQGPELAAGGAVVVYVGFAES